MTSSSPYKMTLSLNVLQHLGLNLYSNVPAVLSEVVANSWDADAKRVVIDLDRDSNKITIQDDGIGMNQEGVNNRFLRVGYRRRDDQPGITRLGRAPMGRKGIGKLSLFSIASEIVVETAQNGNRCALRMRLDEIRNAISGGEGAYLPEALSSDTVDFENGTRITLLGLRKRQTLSTAEGLRKRLARRFSIIGPENDFSIVVNSSPIEPSDRGYYDRVQYIWTYGDQADVVDLCTTQEHKEERDRILTTDGGTQLEISGWLGTVRESSQLRDDYGENLNRIAIFVRGKMAQEDVLADFTERGVYASYLLGELRVDALDVDDDEDAATSSRQRIVEDDERFVCLKNFIQGELKNIQNRWSTLRSEAGARKAEEIPAVKAWIDDLPGDLAPRARQWLGKIHLVSVDDPTERAKLVKHAVLAFEFYRWNKGIERLEAVDEANIEVVVGMFRELDGLEANLYGQIVQQRIAVIRTLREKVDENAKERAIQEYIFDHLWLLDPAWERAEASELMERRVDQLFGSIATSLTPEEKAGRIDIQYRKTAGQHVIIELKRPERSVSVHELGAQIGKYRSGVQKIIDDLGTPHEPIEFVCLLGKPPTEWSSPGGKQAVERLLDAQNARYVNYDMLLENAYQSYHDYLENAKPIDRIGQIIKSLDDYTG